MKKIIFFITFVYLYLPVFSQTVWQISQASITFKIKNAGLNVEGKLTGFEGKISFEPTNLAQSQIQASVKVETIETGIGARDKHLKKEEYFYAEKYPKIEMISKGFEAKNATDFVGYFTLNLKGKSREISFPFKYQITSETATLEGNFTINRQDYGVGENSWVLSDKATIFIKINLKKP